MRNISLYLSHLSQGESGGLGLEPAELAPLVLGHVLGHQGVGGLDLGEGRGSSLEGKKRNR